MRIRVLSLITALLALLIGACSDGTTATTVTTQAAPSDAQPFGPDAVAFVA